MKTYPGPHLEIVSGTWQILKGARNNKRTKEDLGRSFYLAPVAVRALGRPLSRSGDPLTASLTFEVSRRAAFIWVLTVTGLPAAASFYLIFGK